MSALMVQLTAGSKSSRSSTGAGADKLPDAKNLAMGPALGFFTVSLAAERSRDTHLEDTQNHSASAKSRSRPRSFLTMSSRVARCCPCA